MIVRVRGRKRSPSKWLLLVSAVLIGAPGLAQAQEPIDPPDMPQEEPIGPPVGLTLEECLALGMQRQPALHAAQASLSATIIGQQALDNMRFAALFSKDIPVRRQQACLGVTIKSAELRQTEWETRYAITRTYYSVIYARMQADLIADVAKRLAEARDQAKHLVEKAAGAVKVTQLDVDALTVNLELVKMKQAEAEAGIRKAVAGLREAIGVGPEYPLYVAADELPGLHRGLHKETLIAAALANRGEMTMAALGSEVTALEIEAQSRLRFTLQAKTFAAGSDIHAQPVPTGVANTEYRPGAIGPEMPVYLVGRRPDRMDRASAFYTRSLAVVDKTQNLVALDVEAQYLKWVESGQKAVNLEKALELAEPLARDVQKRFNSGDVSGEDYLRSRTLVDQTRALYNEALFNHALALAGVERATAGAFVMPRKIVTVEEE